MSFGHNLKSIRKDMKLTQHEMADKIGISRSYYADIEMNRKNISIKVVFEISNKLNISVNKLINDEIQVD